MKSVSEAAGPQAGQGVHPTSRRGLARRLTVQALYQWILNQTLPDTLIKEFREMPDGLGRADPQYFSELLHGTVNEAAVLTTQIVPFLDRPLNQLDPVEHAVLLMGAFELNHRPEVPYRVVVNEAVNLAKVFGAEDGYKFVNGVLDKLAKRARGAEIDAGM